MKHKLRLKIFVALIPLSFLITSPARPAEVVSATQKGGAAPSVKTDTTEFVAGATGIRVSSPVLGVIILAISLVFLYLY